jgi:hypothetical protein
VVLGFLHNMGNGVRTSHCLSILEKSGKKKHDALPSVRTQAGDHEKAMKLVV